MKLRVVSKNRAASLADILAEDDDLHLLDGVEARKATVRTPHEPVISNFLELVNFVAEHGHEPRGDVPAEKMLAMRLATYRKRHDLRARVREYDTVGLLRDEESPKTKVQDAPTGEGKDALPDFRSPASLDDIFQDDDDLGLLDGIETSVFQISHIPTYKEKDIPDEIASRKPCEDFFRYEKLFQDIQKVLKTQAVMQTRFSREETVVVGNVFILRGMLCYIDKILKEDTSDAERDNPRLRVIFENGTETDLLKRSLIRALYKDSHGKFVDFGPNFFSNTSVSISPKDQPTGYIYILTSETDSPALATWKNAGLLVKIGYSTQDVRERIKNAVNEPTYLEAPVKLRASIACYNLNLQKFEHLVHAFLRYQRLNMKLIGRNGTPYHPEEWFTVDWQTALEVCQRIVDGTITQYRMDNTTGKMVRQDDK